MAQFTQFNKWITQFLKDGLSDKLIYHSWEHTKRVLRNAMEISASVNSSNSELKLIKTAALLHDVGLIIDFKEHEKLGCDITRHHLPRFNYTPAEIETICGMIMATKIPQRPHNLLEKIIADADVMYIGTKDYDKISNFLYEEMMIYNRIKNKQDWLDVQVNFLEKHSFHTEYCISNFADTKRRNLYKLKHFE